MAEYQLSLKNGLLRMAVHDKKRITALDFEKSPSAVGGIYQGRVIEILRPMHAALVDIGRPLPGLIPIKEGSLPPLTEGQTIMVQITREAMPKEHKGVRLTRLIKLALGPLIYTPFTPGLSFSKRLDKAYDRQFIKDAAKEKEGIIVRSLAPQFTAQHLLHLLSHLRIEWEAFEKETAPAPHCLKEGRPLIAQIIRGITPKDQVVIDDRHLHHQAVMMAKDYHLDSCLKFSTLPAFSEEAEEAWDSLSQHEISLPQGGNLIIDETAGLAVIDLNSHGSTLSLLHFNQMAVKEALYQIQLRDLSGSIVIDLAGHPRSLKQLMKNIEIPTDIQVLGISALGLLEISRRRVRPSLPQRLLGAS